MEKLLFPFAYVLLDSKLEEAYEEIFLMHEFYFSVFINEF